MDSIEKRNSITYDAEKDELKIITYYDERRYKEIWVRDLQIGFFKYMMQTWDLKIRNSWLAIILALWCVYWLIIIGVTLYVLVLFLRSPSFGFILIFAFLIYLWFSAITFRKYWLKKGIQAAQSDDFFKAKKLGPTMAAIEYAFEKQPVFRQELTITRDGHTATMPYPDAPLVRSVHGESYIRAFRDQNDLFFLQLGQPKRPYPYYPVENIHLMKDDYTPDEWEVLVEKLREMQYFLG